MEELFRNGVNLDLGLNRISLNVKTGVPDIYNEVA